MNNNPIQWARHIYAKPSPNPYKIKKLEKWVFTHFLENTLNFTDFYKNISRIDRSYQFFFCGHT